MSELARKRNPEQVSNSFDRRELRALVAVHEALLCRGDPRNILRSPGYIAGIGKLQRMLRRADLNIAEAELRELAPKPAKEAS